MSDKIIELTQENFESTITQSPTLIIDFWAPWCGPCRQFAPTFEAAAEKHPEIKFAKLNTEEQQEIASAFRIRSIPTLMVFRDNIMIYSQAGALPPAQLDELISSVNALDMDQVRAEIAAQEQGNQN